MKRSSISLSADLARPTEQTSFIPSSGSRSGIPRPRQAYFAAAGRASLVRGRHILRQPVGHPSSAAGTFCGSRSGISRPRPAHFAAAGRASPVRGQHIFAAAGRASLVRGWHILRQPPLHRTHRAFDLSRALFFCPLSEKAIAPPGEGEDGRRGTKCAKCVNK